MKILGIYRAQRFSPNSVENDRKILDAALSMLDGCSIDTVTEEQLLLGGMPFDVDSILSMARSEEALRLIEGSGVVATNRPFGVRLCCRRSSLNTAMEQYGVPVPPASGDKGVWVKRGNGTAEHPDDVTFCTDERQVKEAMARLNARGVGDVVRQAHIEGDLIKFYGVAGTGFFHYLYPNETGHSKFGSESRNGTPRHYSFSVSALKALLSDFAQSIGVPVFGGDAIVRADGSFCIIDFNDWPSFSSCRQEAARAISSLI